MDSRPAYHIERVAYVDGLRGVAVLGVVLLHAFGSSARPSFAPYIVAVGARGVELFFVISGFCLSLAAVAPQGRPHKPTPLVPFLISRFARIAPPFYIALGLFAALSLTPFGLPTVAVHPSTNPVPILEELFSEAAFINTSPVYNASFWTLAIEAQWYLLCPLLIRLFISSKPAFIAFFLALYVLYDLPWRFMLAGTLPCFMLGIFAAFLTSNQTKIRGRVVTSTAVFALTIAVLEQSRTPEFDHGNTLWHATCFLILVAASYGHLRRVLSWKPLRTVGIASYSIYLVHQPFLAWGIAHHVPPALAAMLTISIGFAFWYAVERSLARSWQRKINDCMLRMVTRRSAWTREPRAAAEVS